MNLLKVDLEKKLLKQNKKLILPKELLLIKEYDKLSNNNEGNALKRVGMFENFEEGKKIADNKTIFKQQTGKFDQKRVFHISQIKSLCQNYDLRFLPSRKFKGTIDADLASKISTFEIVYSEYCNEGNCFIMAPKSSFKLEERPKDPLFFFKINEEFYFLIHKWGNDLNILRSEHFKRFILNAFWGVIITLWFFLVSDINVRAFIFAVLLATGIGLNIMFFPKNNDWNSEYN